MDKKFLLAGPIVSAQWALERGNVGSVDDIDLGLPTERTHPYHSAGMLAVSKPYVLRASNQLLVHLAFYSVKNIHRQPRIIKCLSVVVKHISSNYFDTPPTKK